MNRLVRTRMPGGVAGVSGEMPGAPMPIEQPVCGREIRETRDPLFTSSARTPPAN